MTEVLAVRWPASETEDSAARRTRSATAATVRSPRRTDPPRARTESGASCGDTPLPARRARIRARTRTTRRHRRRVAHSNVLTPATTPYSRTQTPAASAAAGAPRDRRADPASAHETPPPGRPTRELPLTIAIDAAATKTAPLSTDGVGRALRPRQHGVR